MTGTMTDKGHKEKKSEGCNECEKSLEIFIEKNKISLMRNIQILMGDSQYYFILFIHTRKLSSRGYTTAPVSLLIH